MPSSFTGFGYNPPSTAAQPNASQPQSSGLSTSDWIDLFRLGYGIYKDRNPSKPEFEPTPLSPEQQEYHRLYLESLMNPATRNNAAIVNNIAQQQLAGLSGMRWTSPKTFSGDTGYSGSGLGYSFNSSPTEWAPSTPYDPGNRPTLPQDYPTPWDAPNPWNSPEAPSWVDPNNRGRSDLEIIMGDLPFNGNGNFQQLYPKLTSYLDRNPGMVKQLAVGGTKALLSMLGPVGSLLGFGASKLYDALAARYQWGKPQELPQRPNALKDVFDKAPGTLPEEIGEEEEEGEGNSESEKGTAPPPPPPPERTPVELDFGDIRAAEIAARWHEGLADPWGVQAGFGSQFQGDDYGRGADVGPRGRRDNAGAGSEMWGSGVGGSGVGGAGNVSGGGARTGYDPGAGWMPAF